jgi:hypothetical protein
MPTINVVVPV